MIRIERVLCPVDFSGASVSALASAWALARHHRAKLYLQHVFRFEPRDFESYAPSTYLAELWEMSIEEARERLHAFAESYASGEVDVVCELSLGWIPDAILSFASQQYVDLIVMATHGRGLVADHVLRKARCPVVVRRVPDDRPTASEAADGPIELHRIVFCTDLEPPSRGTLEYALALAEEHHADVTLLHVVERGLRTRKEGESMVAATRHLDELIASLPAGAVRIGLVVRAGKAHEQIVEQASEIRADLAIMPVRPRHPLHLAVFGSTTHEVIQSRCCPVLTLQGAPGLVAEPGSAGCPEEVA